MNRLHVLPSRARKTLNIMGALVLAVAIVLGAFAQEGLAASPSFVQSKAREIASGTTNSVTFSKSNVAGNLIVVSVLWNNTGNVSMSDSRGNTYAAATSRTTWDTGSYSSQIFYAKNIAGGSNTVKATFATSINSFAIVQVHEYAGIDKTNPLDGTVGATGTGAAMSTGSLNTTASNDLLFAGSGCVGAVNAVGSGYTARLNTSGNRTMDKVVAAPGAYNATATGSGPGWVLQLVAFKADAGVDTTAPTVPGNLTASAASDSQINLSWTASSDNVGVASYQIERCQGAGCSNYASLATVTGTSLADGGLSASTAYGYRVRAVDAAGNASGYAVTNATTQAPADSEAPSAPTNLASSSVTETQVSLAWTAATDNVGVTGYKIFRDGAQIGVATTTQYQDSGLTPNTQYSYAVAASDAAGNASAQSAALAVTTLTDVVAPSAPANLTAQAASATEVSLTWPAATDNIGVSGYRVYRDGTQIATVPTTTFQDTSLSAGVTYAYAVSAFDAAGNESPQVTASATTPTAPQPGSCPLPAYPTPNCTGVPAGTTLSNTINGDYMATTSGAVIDGWHITGSLIIRASNVTIKNSQIDGTVTNEYGGVHYTPFTITDTTIGPATGCITSPGLGEAGYTAQRVYIRGHDDGFRMSGNNVSITDSFAKLCYVDPSGAPPDGSHSDGIQSYCPDQACSGLTFNHNTVDARGIPATFMLNLVDPNLSAVTANDNLLAGGAYTVVTKWHSGVAWTLNNNRIVDGSWTYGPVSAEGTCSQQQWSGNSIVTIDSAYGITSTVSAQPCVE